MRTRSLGPLEVSVVGLGDEQLPETLGRVTRERPPEPRTRLHGRTIDDADLDRVERLTALAEAHDASLVEVAIGGLAAVEPIVSVIAGATKPEQVRANAAAAEKVSGTLKVPDTV